MRRLLTAAALGAALLITAGCAGKDNDESAAQPTASATSASPTPSASASANYAADTKKICTEIDKSLETEMENFGEELGKMIAYKQAGNTTRANQAKADAQAELKAIACVSGPRPHRTPSSRRRGRSRPRTSRRARPTRRSSAG